MKKKLGDHIIMAIHVTNRVKQASRVQDVLTKYGASIKTRIGLHEATQAKANGLILVEFVGTQRRSDNMLAALNAITGVEAKSIVFEH
jgi:ACT domain-containing protein